MFFLGHTFCGGKYTGDVTPSDITKIKKVRITNIIVDAFFLTKDTSNKMGILIPPVSAWNFDTIVNAPFEGNLLGGNVNFTADQVKSIRIKRVENDSYNWLTLFEIPIDTNDNLSFFRRDITNRGSQMYKYAFVPVWNENNEGNYNINTVYSEFESVWIAEKDMAVNALLNLEMQTTRNIISSVITPIGRKYPYVNQYGNSNYTSGSFDATFINLNEVDYMWDINNAVKYREKVESFLTNGNPKIIKHDDGRIYLANISDSIPKNESVHHQMPIQTISFVEIGNYNSSADLYDANIIDVDIERGVNNDVLLPYTV